MSACPECAYFGSKVTMTRRLQGGWVKRWRRCLQEDCGHGWTTFELPSYGIEPPEDSAPEFLKELKLQESNDG
jgi:transcriptional regulator NrdR family protein